MTRAEFAQMIREVKENPSDDALMFLTDDLGYLEVLAALVTSEQLAWFVDGDNTSSGNEPIFLNGKINWPAPKGD